MPTWSKTKSAPTSPSEAGVPGSVHGVARLSFVHEDGTNRLHLLDQRAPLRVLFPEPHDPGVPLAVLVTTSGGLVGGDVLDVAISAGAGAAALVTTQAAEKVYRSEGAACEMRVALEAGAGAWLEWLPNETIVFDAAKLRRRTTVSLAADARLLAGEIVVLGRLARGERFTSGTIHDAWEIRRDGRLVWTDAFRLDEDLAQAQASPGGLAGAGALATIVFAGEVAERLSGPLAALAERLTNVDLRVGTTRMGAVLLTRLLAQDPRALRGAFAELWAYLRGEAGPLSPRLPRLWSI
jgi:urease accessory protein